MDGSPVEILRLGLVEYDDGLDLQGRLRDGVGSKEVPDQLVLLQHPPVVTLGRNAGNENLLLSPEGLAARGIDFHKTGRGGDVTFHGPGQLVGYPILDLDPDRRDVRRYVRDLEESIIRTLADYGVGAGRVPGLTGVWIGDFKIAAIGVRISRWITSHGFAFNLATDLGFYDVIVPCGIRDRGVTSLERVLGEPVDWAELCDRYVARFSEVFDREPVERAIDSRSVQVFVWRRAGSGIEVLLLKRTPDDGGFWQPVTGIVETDERPPEAAGRETLEETGIAGSPVDLEYVRDFRLARQYVGGTGPHPWINREHAFAMETVAGVGVSISPREHEAYRWATPERALEMLRWSGNKKALARLVNST